uniref:Uncharacterized protein n=1 Tax=Arundo donax TaxID=35708 RepID=A0A0A9G4P8_ARUDO
MYQRTRQTGWVMNILGAIYQAWKLCLEQSHICHEDFIL